MSNAKRIAWCLFVAWCVWGLVDARQRMIAQAPATAACDRQPGVVRVKVSVSRYPENWRHIVDARAGRNTASDGKTVVDDGLRWPRVLVKNDMGEDERRQAAFRLAGVTKTKRGKARDEYPPAVGRATNAADVRYVDARPNSAQGASMGNQLRKWCNGQRFILVAAP